MTGVSCFAVVAIRIAEELAVATVFKRTANEAAACLAALGCAAACSNPLPLSANGPGVSYTACSLVGAYDRVLISKRDDGKGTCTRIGLVSPSNESVIPISVPADWSVEIATISNEPSDCEFSTRLVVNAVSATGGTGSIVWSTQAGFAIPTQLSVHAALNFVGASASWAPPADELNAGRLTVTSCR
jgi:hypothetical protein